MGCWSEVSQVMQVVPNFRAVAVALHEGNLRRLHLAHRLDKHSILCGARESDTTESSAVSQLALPTRLAVRCLQACSQVSPPPRILCTRSDLAEHREIHGVQCGRKDIFVRNETDDTVNLKLKTFSRLGTRICRH